MIADRPLRGNEHDLFVRYYGALLREWRDLWEDYRPAA